ncbi:hypothetical protein FB451DRAFT_1043330 [Mycena latifolia]|nr:hypothetical protein FB451DRAFT_1043330 [Mycena latifolia]
MPHYPNPAHAQGPPRNGQFYTLTHTSGQPSSSFASPSPSRRRMPFIPYSPAQGFKAAAGRKQLLHEMVTFDYPGQARQGVSMRELRLKGTSTPLQGAGDLVLAQSGLQRVVFRILWPGYGHVEWCRTISVVSPNGAPITRVALGVQIASNFINFFERTRYEAPTAVDWMISPSCVCFEDLYLISLQNTFENVWQADIAQNLS